MFILSRACDKEKNLSLPPPPPPNGNRTHDLPYSGLGLKLVLQPMLAAAKHFSPHVLCVLSFNFAVYSQLKKTSAVDFVPLALQLSFETARKTNKQTKKKTITKKKNPEKYTYFSINEKSKSHITLRSKFGCEVEFTKVVVLTSF